MSKKTLAVLFATLFFSIPAFSQPYSWNLSRDVMTPSAPGPTYLSLNPTVPTTPANGVWTFAKLQGGAYSPLTSLNTACAPSLSVPLLTTICWESAPGLLPLVGASPTATVNLNNGFSMFDLIQGMVMMHPANNAQAVVSWRSSGSAAGTAGFTGNVRILGRVSDLDTACGDGVQLRIRKSTIPGPLPIPASNTVSVPFTSVPSAPIILNSSKTFSVASTSVAPGTEILFIIDKVGNELCDSTSLDVLITEL